MTWPPKAWLEHRLQHERYHAKANVVVASIWALGALAGAPWLLWIPAAVFASVALDHALCARKAKRELAARRHEPSLSIAISADTKAMLRKLGDVRTKLDAFDKDRK